MINRGILSITDPCGRYMGMQTTARAFLTDMSIDISFTGTKEHPTAVVLALTEPDSRHMTHPPTAYVKADYFANGTDELFSTLLSKASSSFQFDKLMRAQRNIRVRRYGGSTYNVYYNNGSLMTVTREEFNEDVSDFTRPPTLWAWSYSTTQAEETDDDDLQRLDDFTLRAENTDLAVLPRLLCRMPNLKRADLSAVDLSDASCLKGAFGCCPGMLTVILNDTIRTLSFGIPVPQDSPVTARKAFGDASEKEQLAWLALPPDARIFFTEYVPPEQKAADQPNEPDAPKPAPAPQPKPAPQPAPKPAGKPQFPEGSPVRIVDWKKYEAYQKKQRNAQRLGVVIGFVVVLLVFLLVARFSP